MIIFCILHIPRCLPSGPAFVPPHSPDGRGTTVWHKDSILQRQRSFLHILWLWFHLHSLMLIQGGSNITGTICVWTSHSLSRSYLNHLVCGDRLDTESESNGAPRKTSSDDHVWLTPFCNHHQSAPRKENKREKILENTHNSWYCTFNNKMKH